MSSESPRSDAPLVELDDAELMRRAAGGESPAIEVLYDRYNRIVFSFALRIVGDRRAPRNCCKRCSSVSGGKPMPTATGEVPS